MGKPETLKVKLRFVLAVAAVAIAMGVSPNRTLAADDYKAPERVFPDLLGVDMAQQMFVYNITFMSIGDATGGLADSFHGHHLETADYDGSIEVSAYPLTETYVRIGPDQSYTFIQQSNVTFLNGYGGGGTLDAQSVSSGNYTYTSEDGSIYTFAANILTSIVHPNGVKILHASQSGVSSVYTNTGYAFVDDGSGTTKAINMLAHSCDAQGLSCVGFDASDSRVGTFTDPAMSPPGTMQFTDAGGNAWRYKAYVSYVLRDPHNPGNNERGPLVLWAYRDPTGVLVTSARNSTDGSLQSVTTAVGTYTYTATTLKDPGNSPIYSISSTFNSYNGDTKLNSVSDPLGRQTTYNIPWVITQNISVPSGTWPEGQYSRILSITHPEGDSVSYGYDARGNVTSVTHTGKSGSGLTAVMTASYPSTCSSLITCNKPTWTKDAKGNETDYTYDGTHGGVLTITLPADQNDLRRRTYNTYTAFDTGNGLIYRLTRSETCGLSSSQLSLTACPADINTSVTLTDYGSSSTAPYTYKSFQPYQVTVRDNRSSGYSSQTTTYYYDVIGNVLVVDGPRTDVDDKAYKLYDANRRVTWEAGVLPGGTGSPKRTVVHHVYDGAGRELRTETGYENDAITNGSDFVTMTGNKAACASSAVCNNTASDPNFHITSFKRMTYDAAGRLVKTELVQP